MQEEKIKFTLGSEGPVCAGGPGVLAGGRGGFPKVGGRSGGGRGAAAQAPARHPHLLHDRLVQVDLRSADGWPTDASARSGVLP